MKMVLGAGENDGNGFRSGHARVFEEQNGGEWVKVGQDIDGEASRDYSGESVAMSSDGKRVIIGADGNDGNMMNICGMGW